MCIFLVCSDVRRDVMFNGLHFYFSKFSWSAVFWSHAFSYNPRTLSGFVSQDLDLPPDLWSHVSTSLLGLSGGCHRDKINTVCGKLSSYSLFLLVQCPSLCPRVVLYTVGGENQKSRIMLASILFPVIFNIPSRALTSP